MTAESSTSLFIGIVALTIAVWGPMVGSATREIDSWESRETKTLVATIVLSGGVGVTLAIILGVAATVSNLGSFGMILVYILAGSVLLNIPHLVKLGKITFTDPHNGVSKIFHIASLLSGLTILLAIYSLSNMVG